jgi:hypothetical protein
MATHNVGGQAVKTLVRPAQYATTTDLFGWIDTKEHDFAMITVSTGGIVAGRAGNCRVGVRDTEPGNFASANSASLTPKYLSLSGTTVGSSQTHVMNIDCRNKGRYVVFATTTAGASASFSVTAMTYSGGITPVPTADQPATTVQFA